MNLLVSNEATILEKESARAREVLLACELHLMNSISCNLIYLIKVGLDLLFIAFFTADCDLVFKHIRLRSDN